jgi:membrane protein
LLFFNFGVSLAVLTILFSLLFKWLPERELAWREVWLGGFVTALLFNIGKSAIAWYVGTQGFESTYGAAASIVVLLIWVYYSAQIVLFGAELTQAYAAAGRNRGRHG